MKLLVCGSRTWTDQQRIEDELIWRGPTLVIHGGASGADRLSHLAARRLGIPTAEFAANWEFYGRFAGVYRNTWMLELGNPDEVLAFWDGASRGTEHTIELARARGIPVTVIDAEPRKQDVLGACPSNPRAFEKGHKTNGRVQRQHL